MPYSKFRNNLVRLLPQDDLDAIAPYMELVPIRLKQRLLTPKAPIDYVYFPESGLVSIIAEPQHSHPIEVGHIGREGMTNFVAVNGASASPLLALVQIAGSAWRIDSAQFAVALSQRPTLTNLVMRFHQTFIIQLSYTALSHGRENTEARLCHWLLMCHDRMDGNELPLVHDFLSMMLAIRRPSVTIALQRLVAKGAIKAARGRISILDRSLMEQLAGSVYGMPEQYYREMMGVDIWALRRAESTEDDQGDELVAQ